MVIWSYSYAPHSYTIFPSFETSSKMSLKKAIFDKNVLFKGHLMAPCFTGSALTIQFAGGNSKGMAKEGGESLSEKKAVSSS